MDIEIINNHNEIKGERHREGGIEIQVSILQEHDKKENKCLMNENRKRQISAQTHG